VEAVFTTFGSHIPAGDIRDAESAYGVPHTDDLDWRWLGNAELRHVVVRVSNISFVSICLPKGPAVRVLLIKSIELGKEAHVRLIDDADLGDEACDGTSGISAA
jgi:hypothetical protein